ncbi:hypothetical protein GCM10009678_86360 [Actinomadura kijaniata]|uniref:Uncharacterized protein n=1 Tax=Actinomadura namibiensis TaxID=182080 RepID=A0A7W3M0G6_ACTNM|nr:DUF3307 domain-containing protein [Actinomadura namibiensis]MBA8957710.1 hypothetical protein [Actinomadura namibiensis]
MTLVQAWTTPGALGAVFAALYAAHQFGDHWVQTHRQAVLKGMRGRGPQVRRARRLCVGHVLSLAATKLVALLVVAVATGLELSPVAVAMGLVVDGISHYWADRREPLIALAERIGKGGWIQADPQAAYLLDQSFHVVFLLVAALIIAAGAA